MEGIMSLHFWVSFFSMSALIAIPIVMIGKAKPFKSFLAASVIYIGMIILSACNVLSQF